MLSFKVKLYMNPKVNPQSYLNGFKAIAFKSYTKYETRGSFISTFSHVTETVWSSLESANDESFID